jgi:N-[(2S)-2-amino-2-carboxyethyl]-L-glutamate dehydrogenase
LGETAVSAPRIHSEQAISEALAELDVLEVISSAFSQHQAGSTSLPVESCLRWRSPTGGAARSIAMHAHLSGPPERAGMKLINAAIDNPLSGLPRAGGFIALFHLQSAQVSELMPAAEISATRTAALSALAARHLASAGSVRLGLLGAGALGAAHVKLLHEEMVFSELRVFDHDAERAETLAMESGIEIAEVAPTAELAVRNADIVVAATTVSAPYVELGWLAPGSLFLNVSLDDLLPDVFRRVERLYVDDWQMVLADDQRLLGKLGRAGEILAPGSEGSAGARALSGELGELFTGRCPGRQSETERIVVNPFGLAICDITLAGAVIDAIDSKQKGGSA